MKRQLSQWGLLLLYMGIIFLGSSLSGGGKRLFLFAPDIFWHGIEYAILGFLLYRFLRFQRPTASFHLLWLGAWLGGSLYGATDEFHQYFVPNRHMSAKDWAADTIGTAIGGGLAALGYYSFSRLAKSGPLPEASSDASIPPIRNNSME